MRVLVGAGINPLVRGTDLAGPGALLGQLLTLGGAVDISGHEALANPGGGALDSNPWNFAQAAGGTLVTDAGANALLRVAADGSVSTLAVFDARVFSPVRPTESVPTGVAIGPDGAAYVGELTGFPFPAGAARIHRVAADGTQSVLASGGVSAWFVWDEAVAGIEQAQRSRARFAAAEIEGALARMQAALQASADKFAASAGAPDAALRIELASLLRHHPALSELRWLDAQGQERLALRRYGLAGPRPGPARSISARARSPT
ncbi:MAG: ScyD/ScyE family protein [Roseateles sp.]